MKRQLVIPIESGIEYSFENFYPGQNTTLISQLERISVDEYSRKVLYMWGEGGAGKTHLLNACCHKAAHNATTTKYLTAEDIINDITVLNVSENLLCIDGIDQLVGNDIQEQALFELMEKLTQLSSNLVVTAKAPLSKLNIRLKDLESRLFAGGVYRVFPLSDEEKKPALQQRAHQLGFELPDQVLTFILGHYSRDTRFLFSMLDRLDSESLAQQRKITIPFVREMMDQGVN